MPGGLLGRAGVGGAWVLVPAQRSRTNFCLPNRMHTLSVDLVSSPAHQALQVGHETRRRRRAAPFKLLKRLFAGRDHDLEQRGCPAFVRDAPFFYRLTRR
jgi:hypothetical protein